MDEDPQDSTCPICAVCDTRDFVYCCLFCRPRSLYQLTQALQKGYFTPALLVSSTGPMFIVAAFRSMQYYENPSVPFLQGPDPIENEPSLVLVTC